MDLLVIRHAIALDVSAPGAPRMSDDERPLTDEGREKMAAGAKGLRTVVPVIDLLVTSPLLRARQTAEIVAARYDMEVDAMCDALRPEARPEAFAAWAADRADAGVMAVVGHEPHLSTLVGWLIAGKVPASLELKKGGACLVDLESLPHAGAGTLRWLCTPKLLRRVGA